MPISARRIPAALHGPARAFRHHVLRSYPAFFLSNLPRALRPRTFADHVRRKMLFDRRPYLSMTADKIRARDYVREKVGEHVLTKAYAIAEDPRTIDWSALPRTYVCKATHGSGGIIVVTDDADPDARLPTEHDRIWSRAFVLPEHAPPDQVTEVCLRWVRNRYGWGTGSTHEHQYRRITPHVIVEELLKRPDGALAYDHKLHIVHGRCELIAVISDRMIGKRTDFFTSDWTRAELRDETPPADVEPPPPANLAEMVRIAETLGAETDFARVDLYDMVDRIVFGEITNTPDAGRTAYDPEFDRLLGAFWARGH